MIDSFTHIMHPFSAPAYLILHIFPSRISIELFAFPWRSSLVYRRWSGLFCGISYFFLCIIFLRRNVLGGKLCLNFSAFSESFKTRVYRWRWQRTLNLIWADFLFRFMRAAVIDSQYQLSFLNHIPRFYPLQ